jgi:hypothetical protein
MAFSSVTENNPSPDDVHLLAEVKEHVRSAQYAALKAVNTERVGLCWDIGPMIVERRRDGPVITMTEWEPRAFACLERTEKVIGQLLHGIK